MNETTSDGATLHRFRAAINIPTRDANIDNDEREAVIVELQTRVSGVANNADAALIRAVELQSLLTQLESIEPKLDPASHGRFHSAVQEQRALLTGQLTALVAAIGVLRTSHLSLDRTLRNFPVTSPDEPTARE